jgi:phage-related protein
VIREALQALASFIRAIAALLRGDVDGFFRYLGDSVNNLRELVTTAIRGAVEAVGNLIGVNLTGVLSFIERVNNALLSVRNLGLNVAQAVGSAISSIRLPFGAGGQQQQQTTQNTTNNYVLNVNAASSQGVMSDFELMRRLGWR